MKNIEIVKEGLSLELCPPDFKEGYYRGTRFDHSGVFRRIILNGKEIAGQWFDSYDPYKHDAVCATSEEFTESGYDSVGVGGVFLKPGVGLIYKEDEPLYDRFRLYRVADAGERTVEVYPDSVEFKHMISGDGWGYEYVKVVKILDGGSFEILHELRNTGEKTITGQTYNHNFFTFDNIGTGASVEFDLPFEPCGNWRSEYDSVALTKSGIRFSRSLVPGESVFMGNLKPVDGEGTPGLVFTQRTEQSSVSCFSDRPFDFMVFWANHRVACLEPYIPYDIKPGESFAWKYTYTLK